jgi:Domain of unknown function (DUF3330)
MQESVITVEPDTVSCEVCLRTVHYSRIGMEEMNDYVRYFCGLECYSHWREEDEAA